MDKGFIYGLLIATSLSILLDFNNIFLFIGIPSEVKYLLLLRYLITERVFDMPMKEELITITYNFSYNYHSGKNLWNSCQLREKVSFLAMKLKEKAHVYVKTQEKIFV